MQPQPILLSLARGPVLWIVVALIAVTYGKRLVRQPTGDCASLHERCSREESHLRRRTARVYRSSVERGWRSRASFATCEVRAASTSVHPCSVNSTRIPRRSSGSGTRLTRPFSVSRSMRLVIVPDVTIIERKSSVGESRYGAPARRRVASISKLQWFRPNCANTGSSSFSTTRDSREIRPTIPMGETSRSGRSAAH